MSKTKQVSIRMPDELVKRLECHEAITPYIIEAVREKLDRDDEARIVASLTCLADDPESNDISAFASIQDEVIRRID
jgi:hypothetical protein